MQVTTALNMNFLGILFHKHCFTKNTVLVLKTFNVIQKYLYQNKICM